MADEALRARYLQNLHELQPAARLAEKEIAQFTPYEAMMQGLWRELRGYQPGEEPHKAVYVLARCYTLLERWAFLYQAIENYNEARRKLEEYDMRRTIENG